MGPRTFTAVLVALLFAGPVAPPQQPGASDGSPAIWAGLQIGKHRVGAARAVRDGIDITYWYPAGSGGRSMRLRDLAADPGAFVEDLTRGGIAPDIARRLVDSPLLGRWTAPRAAGRFPLVLIAQGNAQGPLDQAVLAEFFASHGLAVATTPSPAIKSPMKSADDVGPYAQRQAEELLAAMILLEERGLADRSRIGVVGHSFGARAALLVAMHEPRVQAVASLDGGVGTAQAIDSFARARWFDRNRAMAPILHFYETLDEFMSPDFTFLRTLPSSSLTLREVPALHHAHFTTLGFGAAQDPQLAAATRLSRQGVASIRSLGKDLLAFFERHLAVLPPGNPRGGVS